jgi:hypothetical protein
MNAAMLIALELGEEIIEAVKIRVESSGATRRVEGATGRRGQMVGLYVAPRWPITEIDQLSAGTSPHWPISLNWSIRWVFDQFEHTTLHALNPLNLGIVSLGVLGNFLSSSASPSLLQCTFPMPCSSADFGFNCQGVLATPLFFASGCNYDGVITSVL